MEWDFDRLKENGYFWAILVAAVVFFILFVVFVSLYNSGKEGMISYVEHKRLLNSMLGGSGIHHHAVRSDHHGDAHDSFPTRENSRNAALEQYYGNTTDVKSLHGLKANKVVTEDQLYNLAHVDNDPMMSDENLS